MKSQKKIKSPARKVKKPADSKLSPAAVASLAKAFNVSPRKICQLMSLPEDQLPTLQNVAQTGSRAVDTLVKAACLYEGLAKGSGDEKLKEHWRKEEEASDEALGIMLRNTTLIPGLRAERSRSMELLIWAIGNVFSGMKRLPKLWEQFERIADPTEFNPDEPDNFPYQMIEALVDLLKFFEDQCERHPARFRLLARELPYWPFLVTPHRAGYRKRFDRIAGRGFINLGAECPLDTSARAMYRLQTPVCGLLWEEVFRDWIAVSAGVRAVRRLAREHQQPVDAESEQKATQSAVDYCSTNEAEREIFRAAFALPDLSKATARKWADKFVIPYLHLKLPGWHKVPALAKFIGKKGGDTQAEKEIRRAVVAMARA